MRRVPLTHVLRVEDVERRGTPDSEGVFAVAETEGEAEERKLGMVLTTVQDTSGNVGGDCIGSGFVLVQEVVTYGSEERKERAWRALEEAGVYVPASDPQAYLHMFFNPVSGKGGNCSYFAGSLRTLEDVVKPILDVCGVVYSCTSTTTSADDLRREVRELNFRSIHALGLIGGDGLAQDVLTTLMGREDGERRVKDTPVCIIPGGSDNSLSVALGHKTPLEAVLSLVKYLTLAARAAGLGGGAMDDADSGPPRSVNMKDNAIRVANLVDDLVEGGKPNASAVRVLAFDGMAGRVLERHPSEFFEKKGKEQSVVSTGDGGHSRTSSRDGSKTRGHRRGASSNGSAGAFAADFEVDSGARTGSVYNTQDSGEARPGHRRNASRTALQEGGGGEDGGHDPAPDFYAMNCVSAGLLGEILYYAEKYRGIFGPARYVMTAAPLITTGSYPYDLDVYYRPYVEEYEGEDLEAGLPSDTPAGSLRSAPGSFSGIRKEGSEPEEVPHCDRPENWKCSPAPPPSKRTPIPGPKRNGGGGDWRIIRGPLVVLALCNHNCGTVLREGEFNPGGRPDNGSMDLIYVRDIGACGVINYLNCLTTNEHVKLKSMGRIRVSEVLLAPGQGAGLPWSGCCIPPCYYNGSKPCPPFNTDGELLMNDDAPYGIRLWSCMRLFRLIASNRAPKFRFDTNEDETREVAELQTCLGCVTLNAEVVQGSDGDESEREMVDLEGGFDLDMSDSEQGSPVHSIAQDSPLKSPPTKRGSYTALDSM